MKPMTDFLIEGVTDARLTILLAHGAGAPMDSKSMTAPTAALVAIGFRVGRSNSTIWRHAEYPARGNRHRRQKS